MEGGEQAEIGIQNLPAETTDTSETREDLTRIAMAEYDAVANDTHRVREQDKRYVEEVETNTRYVARVVENGSGNDPDYLRLVNSKDELLVQVGRLIPAMKEIADDFVVPVDSNRKDIAILIDQIKTEQNAQKLEELKSRAVDHFQAVVKGLQENRQRASEARSRIYNTAESNANTLGYSEANELTSIYRTASQVFLGVVQGLNGQMSGWDNNFLASNDEHLTRFRNILNEISPAGPENPTQPPQ